jgi:hypothetical protein
MQFAVVSLFLYSIRLFAVVMREATLIQFMLFFHTSLQPMHLWSLDSIYMAIFYAI